MAKPVTIPNTFATQSGNVPASQLDADYNVLSAAINDVPTYGNYLSDTGAVNALVVTTPANITFSYTTGVWLDVLVANTNTSLTVNLNVNGLGNKSVLTAGGATIPIGNLVAGTMYRAVYDGASFRVSLTSTQIPATPAEIAALVTIVQGTYAPGIPDRYGVNTTPGTTDMTVAWQSALNANLEINGLPDTIYAVTNTGLTNPDGGGISLNVLNNVEVDGHGCTVRKIGAVQQGAVFSNTTSVGVSSIQIKNIVVDCGANLSSGVVLYGETDCDIGPYVTVLGALGSPNGISLGHRATNNVAPHGQNTVRLCRVENAGFLGIQCAHQALGLDISHNMLINCVDNPIDVEGNLTALGGNGSITITGITRDATGAVVTFNAGGASNPLEIGLEIAFSGVVGMTQINGRIGTISLLAGVSGAWTAKIGGWPAGTYGKIDSSVGAGFSAYGSGGSGALSGSLRRVNIIGNIINGGLTDAGIFVESAGNVLIEGNTIENITAANAAGIILNQINTQAFESLVIGNRLKNIPNGHGIALKGTGKTRIDNNSFKTMVNSIHLSPPSQFLSLGRNTHENITGNTLIYYIPSNGSQYDLIWSGFEPQDYFGPTPTGLVGGSPFTASPIDNLNNPSTVLNGQNRQLFAHPVPSNVTTTISNATRYLQSASQTLNGTPAAPAVAAGGANITALQQEYLDGSGGALNNAGTLGFYSKLVTGETQIQPTVVGSAYVVGDYVWIQGTVPNLYQLNANIGGGIFTIRQANYAQTVTVAPSGTSATLTAAFTKLTGAYLTYFTDGQTRNVTYTNGSTAITWAGALTGTPGVALMVMNVGGDWTANFTGAHPIWGYFPQYQTENGT
jgi:hypothetical protein